METLLNELELIKELARNAASDQIKDDFSGIEMYIDENMENPQYTKEFEEIFLLWFEYFKTKVNSFKAPCLYILPLNLETYIIHTGQENTINTVCAIYSDHKKIVIIRPEYKDIQESIINFICEKRFIPPPVIKYGDGFNIDTWDKIIKDFRPNRHE